MKRINGPALVGLGAVLNQLDVGKANKYYGEYLSYGGRYYHNYGYSSSATESLEPRRPPLPKIRRRQDLARC